MRRTSAGAVGNEAWPRALDLDQRGLLAEARRRTRFEAERIPGTISVVPRALRSMAGARWQDRYLHGA